jgi:hypothetical protein
MLFCFTPKAPLLFNIKTGHNSIKKRSNDYILNLFPSYEANLVNSVKIFFHRSPRLYCDYKLDGQPYQPAKNDQQEYHLAVNFCLRATTILTCVECVSLVLQGVMSNLDNEVSHEMDIFRSQRFPPLRCIATGIADHPCFANLIIQ